MNTKDTDYYVEVQGVDGNGPFSFLIQKDCSQITIEKEDGDVLYIDIDKSELEIIRDAINKVLDNLKT